MKVVKTEPLQGYKSIEGVSALVVVGSQQYIYIYINICTVRDL